MILKKGAQVKVISGRDKGKTGEILEINRKLECDLPLNGPRTLNGLILEQIETIPEANVSINVQNTIIETVLVRNNMIKIARLIKSTEEEVSED